MKRAIIIGATSGIGRAITQQLSAAGWELGIAGRRQQVLQEMQSHDLNIIATQQIDVTQDNAPDQLRTLIGKMGGHIDLYFHSSGIGFQNLELDPAKELDTVNTNALGFTRMVITAFQHFAEHPDEAGQIAVISSIARTKGLGATPAYSSSKRFVSHYLECLTQLANMRGLKRLTITDIRPGFVRTPLIEGGSYPMQLEVNDAARQILKGVLRRRSIVTVDWRYRLMVYWWQLIPRWLWVRLSIH